MYHEPDFEEEALRAEAILFWGTVGPRTGISVVVADRPEDLLVWLRDRAVVEGRGSELSRALPRVERAAHKGEDAEVMADAIGSALDEAGILVGSCGPLARELTGNEIVKQRVLGDVPANEPVPEGVWRGGEAHIEVEGAAVSPPDGDDDERNKGYRMDDELEDLAEHQTIDFERADHREFLADRLEVLLTSMVTRRAA